MIIIMEHNATVQQQDRVINYIENKGLKVQINKGTVLNVIAVKSYALFMQLKSKRTQFLR